MSSSLYSSYINCSDLELHKLRRMDIELIILSRLQYTNLLFYLVSIEWILHSFANTNKIIIGLTVIPVMSKFFMSINIRVVPILFFPFPI